MTRRTGLAWLRVGTVWCYRAMTWAVLAVAFVLAATVLALRYWLLPNVEHYRDDIARIVSEKSRQKITIGRISANWDGLRPQLVLEDVMVHDAAGRPALALARVDNTLSWMSVPTLQLRFHSLYIHAPTLNVRRDALGRLSVAGIEIDATGDGGGFADWLLSQRSIDIDDATLVWRDELRGAPALELRQTRLQIVNRIGGRHQFGLRAVPPAALAGPLDIRGDFTGRTVRALAEWNGRLFLDLDQVDIAAWRTWVPFPVEFPQGTGGVRAWLTFSEDRLTDATVDLRLANVRTRIERSLPELEVTELSGRFGWKQSASSFQVTTSALRLTTTGGLTLPPVDFLLRHAAAAGRRPAQGEITVNALDFAPVVALADHLPLPGDARAHLAALAPQGTVHDVQVRWTGPWGDPATYSAKGRFTALAMNSWGRIPGFRGVSGTVQGSERGGTVRLDTRDATVAMPLVFREPLRFDTLTASVDWLRDGGETQVRLNSIAFANPDVAGSVIGSYRTAGTTRGSIDLTGSLTRADARRASHYIPLVVLPRTREWLDAAFIAGQASDVTLRLKGDLERFPFPDSSAGVFQVTARVSGGALHYAEGWPRIDNIAGDVLFRGARMLITGRQGSILGVRLANVKAEIPDLTVPEERLIVTGEAEGPTRQFFDFIAQSPVLDMIDRLTENWQVQGSGKLTLKLDLPLARVERSVLAGSYQFSDNTLVADRDLPPVEQVSGRIEFTESSVRTQGIRGTFVGGPVTVSASTQRDAIVQVVVQGRVNTDNALKVLPEGGPWRALRGAADWRATYVVQRRNTDMVLESDLKGLASSLPAPLGKAADEALPVRYERRSVAPGQDRVTFLLGDVVSAQFARTWDGARPVVTRGTVRFGESAPAPEQDGVWIGGTVRTLDLDGWIALARTATGTGGQTIRWGGVELKAGAVHLFGRHFGAHSVTAVMQGGLWRGTLAGDELQGNASWDPQGNGKVIARMKRFVIPPATPALTTAAPGGKPLDLPAIDLVAEQFAKNDKQLGRLELMARPTPDSWRIERLRISNPDAEFSAEGTWHPRLAQPRTQVSLRLDSPDAGKLLARLGYPDGVRNGKTRLEGTLSWVGAPYDFDYPTLSGALLLDVQRGQFTRLDPGIGKLLGVLSLQALPRRLTLDFRDIFSEGLAFDDIVSAIKIERGIASTESFRINGPSARIVMAGTVDLARETQKLRVRVTPSVSDGVSIAGALIGGPVAGVAAFLAQKILKDPLDQIVSYDYTVMGTWAEPQVVRADPPPAAAQQP